jgi:hypothetical protein
MGRKRRQLAKLCNDAIARKETVSPIIFIDGKRQPSASKTIALLQDFSTPPDRYVVKRKKRPRLQTGESLRANWNELE